MSKRIKKFFKQLLSESGDVSSKRFIMLMISAIFIIANLTMLPLLIISYFTKFNGTIETFKIVSDLFKDITEKEHIIVLFAIGAVTSTSVGQYIVQKAKSWKKPSNFGWGNNNDDDEIDDEENENIPHKSSKIVDVPDNP